MSYPTVVLWLLWVGTAGDAVAGATYYFPLGCSSYGRLIPTRDRSSKPNHPTVSLANQYCIEFTVVEALAFVNFFCGTVLAAGIIDMLIFISSAFIYYDVIFLYAIINAVRGRSIWTSSVKEAVTGTPGAVNSGYPMGQPQYNAPPMQYGAYPPNVPPNQPYNAYPQQAQPYSAYPQQVPPQGPPSQQYNAYHPQSPPQAGQYSPAPGSPQQQASYPGYSTSPTGNDAALPPQPNYNAYPVHGSQAPLPLPSGYQA